MEVTQLKDCQNAADLESAIAARCEASVQLEAGKLWLEASDCMHQRVPRQCSVASVSTRSLSARTMHLTALEEDGVLDHIFSFVGAGEHLYAAGVCRQWRCRYLQFCTSSSGPVQTTLKRSALVTESRLQLALSCGLTVAGWAFDKQMLAEHICRRSAQPEQVVALLREQGLRWSFTLPAEAAYFGKLALLQWLCRNYCPWQLDSVLISASCSSGVPLLEWLHTITAPWSSETEQAMLERAIACNQLNTVEWLQEHGIRLKPRPVVTAWQLLSNNWNQWLVNDLVQW
jgi:hypothetical protein